MQNENRDTPSTPGTVYLVGAGPGDPDLLTLKAIKILRKADIVLYDDLLSSHSMRYIKKSAELIYVGKRHGKPSWKQADINHLLVDSAKRYQNVVRLKGGDPAVFARLGEEVEALWKAGISFEVVPGITSASSAVADLGLPFTHRDYASEVLIVSGNKKNGEINEIFRNFSCRNKTLLVYMGISSLEKICLDLIEAGNSHQTPITIIEDSSYENRREISGTLGDIVSIANKESAKSPAIIIIGGILYFHREILGKFSETEMEDLLVFR